MKRNLLVMWSSLVVVAGFGIVVGILWFVRKEWFMRGAELPERIHAYFPFKPIFPVDPRRIVSVGDQVLTEHVLAFHSRQSLRDGFQSSFSQVKLDAAAGEVVITPRFPITNGNGDRATLEDVCSSLIQSFKGTQHSPYAVLFQSAMCDQSEVRIRLSAIPANFKYLLTLPDFAFSGAGQALIDAVPSRELPGPYEIESVQEGEILLKRNPYFPEGLRANAVDDVSLHFYSASETPEILSRLDPVQDHLVYLYGHALNRDDLSRLSKKGYRVQSFPSEWFVNVGFGSKVGASTRGYIADVIRRHRASLQSFYQLGQAAYSVAPLDQAFGITQDEYDQAFHAGNDATVRTPSEPLVIGTLEQWQEIPLFRESIRLIHEALPNSSIRSSKSFSELLEETDISVQMLGISPADPLNHLSFLMNDDPNVAKFITPEMLVRLASSTRTDEFVAGVKQLELRLSTQNILVPLAHFPGVVAEAERFERDESLSGSWGIQTWAYQIR